MKTLTDITAYTDYVEKLNALFESETEDDVDEPVEVDRNNVSAPSWIPISR